MTDADRLERSYRRLMWAYPRWYRRERGAELLTTLLDAAAPGQRRATVLEAGALVWSGIRARLRPSRHVLARVAAGQVAMYLAVVGAAVGVLVSGYPGPPATGEAVAAAMVAVPERPHDVPSPVLACDMFCPGPFRGDDVTAFRRTWEHTDFVSVGYHPSRDEVSTVVGRARERLAAAGWRVSDLRIQDDGFVSFEASDGRLDVTVTGLTSPDLAGTPVSVGVSKSFSARAVAFLVGGSAAGLLVGWLVAAWASQRFRLHRDGRRWAVAAAAAPYLFFGTLLGLGAVRGLLIIGLTDPEARSVKVPLLVLPDPLTPYWALPALIALSALAALALVAAPGPPRAPTAARGVRVSEAREGLGS